ncbi:MAG: hypothetical protein HQK68_13595 [Desulfamplus sp.]|nr:hypothetical protein [Desulfamplus sp.]
MWHILRNSGCSIYLTIICVFISIFALFTPTNYLLAQESSNTVNNESVTNIDDGLNSSLNEPELNRQNSSIEMLLSIIELKKSLQKSVADKKVAIENSGSDSEKDAIKQELVKLYKQLDDATSDFETIATGIDVGVFSQKKVEEFNWQNELLSLAEPGIKELKRLTLKARHKTKLKEDIGHYEALIPVAEQAIANINQLTSKASNTLPNKELDSQFKSLIQEWQGVKEQLEKKLKIAQMQIAQMESEEQSFVESSQSVIKNFFKTRGFYLFMAVAASIAVVALLRLIYLGLIKILPDYQSEYRPFYIRVIDLLFKALGVILTIFALIFVFYYAQDWVLLSLTIIFLMGLGWAVKYSIPILWQQSRLMLNIGSVREGERIIYNGLPWLVKSINVFCTLENPSLDIKIRLPIEELHCKISRPIKKCEIWFPCKKDDWLSLSDGVVGKVTNLSHEMVEVTQQGGAKKVYQTPDFIGLSPLNLSSNFRLSVMFGIGYVHQKEATSDVLEKLHKYIIDQMDRENILESLLNLKVEFCQAGASSLDLIILADFNGKVADQYSKLNRAIQRWCVDACTIHGWDIPFPQLTLHGCSK